MTWGLVDPRDLPRGSSPFDGQHAHRFSASLHPGSARLRRLHSIADLKSMAAGSRALVAIVQGHNASASILGCVGAMPELGISSAQQHRGIGVLARDLEVDVILVKASRSAQLETLGAAGTCGRSAHRGSPTRLHNRGGGPIGFSVGARGLASQRPSTSSED